MSELIARFADYRKRRSGGAGAASSPVSGCASARAAQAPHIVCMAVNYDEDGTRSEPAPINAFMKSPGR